MDSTKASQGTRKERVKSIFDSDDSDEDPDKNFSNTLSNDDDDDDDDDLRKKIDEVCFTLSNEEEKFDSTIGNINDSNRSDLKIPMPAFTMVDDVSETNLSLMHEKKNVENIPKPVTSEQTEITNEGEEIDSDISSNNENNENIGESVMQEQIKSIESKDMNNPLGLQKEEVVLEDKFTKEFNFREDKVNHMEKSVNELKDDNTCIIGSEEITQKDHVYGNLEDDTDSSSEDSITDSKNNLPKGIDMECISQKDKVEESYANTEIGDISISSSESVDQSYDNFDSLLESSGNGNNNEKSRASSSFDDDHFPSDEEDQYKSDSKIEKDDFIDKRKDECSLDSNSTNSPSSTKNNLGQEEKYSTNFKECYQTLVTENKSETENSDSSLKDQHLSNMEERIVNENVVVTEEQLESSIIRGEEDFIKSSEDFEMDTSEPEGSQHANNLNVKEANLIEVAEDILKEGSNLKSDEESVKGEVNIVESTLEEDNLVEMEDIKDKNEFENTFKAHTSQEVRESFLFHEDVHEIPKDPSVTEICQKSTPEPQEDNIIKLSKNVEDSSTFDIKTEEDSTLFSKQKEMCGIDKFQQNIKGNENDILCLFSEDKNVETTTIEVENPSYISDKLNDIDCEESDKDIDKTFKDMESSIHSPHDVSEKAGKGNGECKSPIKPEIATISDMWNAVNIFQSSKTFSDNEEQVVSSKKTNDASPRSKDTDSDSGTDINENFELHSQSNQTHHESKSRLENDKEIVVSTEQTEKTNTGSPWDANKNGSLFEDVQVFNDQSPDYQSEGPKRKKVRVEDVFTDSEGEDSPRKDIHRNGTDLARSTSEGTIIKKAKQKRERATSINLPAIMLAFEKGWIREVVYRSSSGIANKRADIYYYSPCKRKLRSRIELEEFLKKENITDLGLQNFSFFKEPLGVEEKYEKVRHASNLVKLGDSTALSTGDTLPTKPLPKKRVRKPTTKAKDLPPSKKQKVQKEVIKKVMIKEALNKGASSQLKKKGSTPGFTNRPHQYQLSGGDAHVYATHLYPANPPLTQPRIITPVIRGEAKDKTFHCTSTCEAGGGNVPSLQCVKCVCLFHPECCQMPPQTVSIILSSIAKFLCPNCYREENLSNKSFEDFTPCPSFEPLAFDPSSESEDEGMVSDYEHPIYKRINHRPITPTLPPLPAPQEGASSFSNLKPPNLNIPLPPSNQVPRVFPSQLQQIPGLLPNIPVAVPLPSSTTGPANYILYQPVTSKGQTASSPAPARSQFQYKVPTQPPAIPPSVISQQHFATPSKKTPPPPPSPSPPKKEAPPPVPRVTPGVRGDENFFKDMGMAYSLLRKVFSYLHVPELLVASRVCLLWRDLALSPSYWHSIRLGKLHIKDWAKMVEFLEKKGTSELDFRGMVVSQSLIKQMQEIYEGDKDVNMININKLTAIIEDGRTDDENEKQAFIKPLIKDVQFPENHIEEKAVEDNEMQNTAEEPNEQNGIHEKIDQEITHSGHGILLKIPSKSSEVLDKEKSLQNDQKMEAFSDNDADSWLKVLDSAEETLEQETNSVDKTILSSLSKEESSQCVAEEKNESKELEENNRKVEEDCRKEKEESDRKQREDLMKQDEEDRRKQEEENQKKKEDDQKKKEEEEQKKAKEELERKEKEEKKKMSLIVSSVLSEHDYFGRVRTVSSSSSSSESSSSSSSSESGSRGSSSDSSDSEAQMDVTEEDIERTFQSLEEKLSSELPLPVEEETLKPLLQDLPLVQPESKPVDGPTEKISDEPLKNNVSKSPIEEIQDSKEEEEIPKDVEPEEPVKKEIPRPLTEEELLNKAWEFIASEVGKMKTLRRLVVGPCCTTVMETILSRCHQLISFNSVDFENQTENEVISFDPSVLMQTRNLEELRLTSQRSFTFKSNFNFIKLPQLRALVLKGLKTMDFGWPYMGTHLTQLSLSSISTFSHHNWMNLSSMSELVDLELDGNGNDHDTELCSALCKLTNLNRLSLLDWNIGSKLPHTLKRLHNIKHLHVIPAVENQNLKGVFAGRLMVILESSKHLVEFIWGIQPQNIIMEELAGEKIYILNMKAGKETGSVEGEEVRSVAIDSLKGFVKCRIPNTNVTVKKVSSDPWNWSGLV